MNGEKPEIAIVLCLVGVAIQIIVGITMFLGISLGMARMMGPAHHAFGVTMYFAAWSYSFLIITALIIALGVIGIVWMNSFNLARVRSGSLLVLIASIVAFPTAWGLVIGSLLMFIGSLLGLTWQPRA